MQRNFLFFINPIAGTKSKDSLLQLIETTARQKNLSYAVMQTSKDGDYAYLPGKIAAEKISDIVICGGDGTINQVAAQLVNIVVNIGIIPMGSGNGLAFAAGISKDPSAALDIIFTGTATQVDCFYINDKFSCMLCGLGFDAQVAHDFAAQSSRGLSTYIQQGIKRFFTAKTYPFTVDINNTSIRSNAFFISIANSNQFGNNVTIAPRASLSDGLLDIVIVNKMNKIKMIFRLLKQIRSGKVQHITNGKHPETAIQYFQAKTARIHNPSAAPLHIDGDPAETSAYFEIKIREKAFWLLQPSGSVKQ